jgi:hypothetical protein
MLALAHENLKTANFAMLQAAELRDTDLVNTSDGQFAKVTARDALDSTRAALEVVTEWYGKAG